MISTVFICATVYLGMILGGLPFLQLDRTGVALLAAIALLVTRMHQGLSVVLSGDIPLIFRPCRF